MYKNTNKKKMRFLGGPQWHIYGILRIDREPQDVFTIFRSKEIYYVRRRSSAHVIISGEGLCLYPRVNNLWINTYPLCPKTKS